MFIRSLISIGLLSSVALAGELEAWRNRMAPITPRGYVVHQVASPVKVDGHLDDPAWTDAPWTTDFVDIEGAAKPKPRFRTRAKLLWDDAFLYIAAELEEPHVWATEKRHDAVIFQDPDFEVFIDPDGDTHAYSELEINALGTTWDLLLDKPYQDSGSAHNEWELIGMKSAVHVRGTLNHPDDVDEGWTVEIAIPWQAFRKITRHDGPPLEGEQWRLNFSRVEWKVRVEGGTYRKVQGVPEDNWVWSPQGVVDMHRPEMWGILQFTRRAALVQADPIPAPKARDAALQVYYAQRDYRAVHGSWAAELGVLGVSVASGVDVRLRANADGYECRAERRSDGAGWTIRQDRRLCFEASAPGRAHASAGD